MHLGVNIDHIATLREARYCRNRYSAIYEPNILRAAEVAATAGAHSLTIHVREDRRHMQTKDAYQLKESAILPINLEMANTPDMVAMALDLEPNYVCIVPESREEVTTEGGLIVNANDQLLREHITKLTAAGIQVSLFIDPDITTIQHAYELGARVIELHTGSYSIQKKPQAISDELQRLKVASNYAQQQGFKVHAGHGLHYQNITSFLNIVPHIQELNIGHSIIAEALFVGLPQAIATIKQLCHYDNTNNQ